MLIVVAALSAILYVLHQRQKRETQELATDIVTAKLLIAAEKSDEAIPLLEQAVKQPLPDAEEASAKLNLGLAYLDTNPVEGVEILKALSLDAGAPGWYRAEAGQSATSYYLSTQDAAFATSTLFTGPVWGSFFATSSSANLAARSGLEWIAGIYPLFGVEYQLALFYASEISYFTDPTERELYASTTRARIATGDENFQWALEQNMAAAQSAPGALPPFTNYELGNGLTLKARALANLYVQHATTIPVSKILPVYAQAIGDLEQDSSSQGAMLAALYTRYYLAIFLRRVDASAYRSNIIEATAAIASAYANPRLRSALFFSYLKQVRAPVGPTNSGLAGEHRNMVKLASVDPNFRDLLVALGWTEGDLAK